VQQVYSIEIVAPLAEQARKRLAALGYANVEVRNADGYYGWAEHAPFDAIVVTAAAGSIPPALIQQLKVGGRLVIPVGSQFFTQTLMLIEKKEDGKFVTRELMPVAFVPLTGRH
jgi:Protein-L-isoaspartate carboxylmethyltransferase